MPRLSAPRAPRACGAVLLAAAMLLAASFPLTAKAQAPVLVRDLRPGNDPESYGSLLTKSAVFAAGGRIYFLASAQLDGVNETTELWTSDLSEASSTLVRDFCPETSCNGTELAGVELGDAFVFTVFEDPVDTPSWAYDQGLWLTRGTPSSTIQLLPGIVSDLTAVGGLVFFLYEQPYIYGKTLWRTDGTPGGTYDLGLEPANFENLGEVDGRLFFFRNENRNGLWTSDGTAEGTRFVAGSWDYGLVHLTFAGKRIFFVSEDDLWTSDGTAAGTRNLHPGGDFETFSIDPFPVVGDRIYFLDRNLGSALWTSDGTPKGTHLVAPVCVVTSCTLEPSNSAVFKGRLFFLGQDGAHGAEPWMSDGTRKGTGLLRDLNPGPPDFRLEELAPSGDLLFFEGWADESTFGIWTTDGTPKGTQLRIPRASSQVVVPDGAGRVAFYRESLDPWVSDGTAEGTFQVLPEIDHKGILGFYEGRLVVSGGRDLWANDGTPGGTWRLGRKVMRWPLSSRPADFTHLGPLLAFTAQTGTYDGQRSVFASDGTAEGTRRLAPDLKPANTRRLVATSERLFFDAHGASELWSSDGTEAGTELLMSFDGVYDRIVGLEPLGETLYFIYGEEADDLYGTEANGELWISDGTPGGTRALTEAAGGETLAAALDLDAVGDWLYFRTSDGKLYRTDGTAAGTKALATRVREKAALGDDVYFIAIGASGFELRRTDGTAEGTERVRRFGDNRSLRSLIADEDHLFFLVQQSHDFYELWTSDGTEDGTRRIVRYDDFPPHPLGPTKEVLFAAGGRLYFIHPSPDAGDELYVSDGEGVRLLKDICPGRCSSGPRYLAWIDGRLYFSATDGIHGWEPWTSDGTPAGTVRVADLAPGPTSSNPQEFYGLGGVVYFQAYDGTHGQELWALDPSGKLCPEDKACLLGGRFQVAARFVDPHGGAEQPGRPVPFSDETSLFWFFNEKNIELAVKLLDGRRLNDHFWFFSGGLSDVEYWIDVLDLADGTTRTYHNAPGEICGQGDVQAFFDDSRSRSVPAPLSHAVARTGSKAGSCAATATSLCLQDGRFEVTVEWESGDGKEGVGRTIPATDESGYFYFFNERNLELVVKLLDGRRVNGRFWVFYGALSDVEYWITVTDTETGARRVYHNPQGEICGRADTSAF